MIAGCLVPFPIGIGATPVAGQATDITLQPTLVPVELHAQAVGHGRVAGLANPKLHTRCLCSVSVPQQCSRKRGKAE
ncbi:hypothetical protein D3C75_1133230 [compost metagenome]